MTQTGAAAAAAQGCSQTPWAGGVSARLSRRGRWGGERPRETATVGKPPCAGAGVAWVGGEPRGAPRTREAGGGAAPLPLLGPCARRGPPEPALPGVARGGAGTAPGLRFPVCDSAPPHPVGAWARRAGLAEECVGWEIPFCVSAAPAAHAAASLTPRSLSPRSPRDTGEEGLPQAFGARLRAEAGEETPGGERVGPNLYLPAAPGFSTVMT